MVSQLLASPQFAAFVTGLVLAVLWSAVGRAGRFLEAQGAARGIVALVVLGKKLEALGYDGDKLAGKPGAPEHTAADDAIAAAVAKALKEASQKVGS
jgi:hypothetical protein